MKIRKNNIQIFETKEIYFHDQILVFFNYDPNCKKIILETEDIPNDKRTKIVFSEVEGFEMIGGECWGHNTLYRRIIEWVPMLGEDEHILRKVKEYYLSFHENEFIENTFADYFQTRFLFSCGNVLDIVCKEIEIDAGDLAKQANTYIYEYFREKEKMAILCALHHKLSPNIVSDVKIEFLDKNLPKLYTKESMNPYVQSTENWSRCAKFVNEWTCNVRIACKVNLNSSEIKSIIHSWLSFLTKEVIVQEFIVEFVDRKVCLNKNEIDDICINKN